MSNLYKNVTPGLTMAYFGGNLVTTGDWPHYKWTVVLNHNGDTMRVPFMTGTGIKNPTLDDVMSSLLSEYSMVEWEFDGAFEMAQNLGMELDSPKDKTKAEQTWRQMERQAEGMRRLFSEEELEALAEAYSGY